MNIHQFCVDLAIEESTLRDPSRSAKVLDYGCGAGQIVELLRCASPTIAAYGCDIFYDGGSYRRDVDEALLSAGVVREMRDGRIPFGDAEFDVVINNQVMEHVEDLDAVVQEIGRVVKPGGIVLSLFPDASVWREGHSGIPFLHWYRSGSKVRIFHAMAFRAMGFGYYTEGKSIPQWSRDFCEWLDKWTRYRAYDDIRRVYARHIGPMIHAEERLLSTRLGNRAKLVGWLPLYVRRQAVRKLGGMVFFCVKPSGS